MHLYKAKEHNIQASIVQYFRLKNILVFSVPNGIFMNASNKIKAASYMNKLKSEGFLPGTSDLIVLTDKKIVFLEVKTKNGKQSKKQLEFQEQVQKRGYEYIIARSLDDVIKLNL